MEVAGKKFLAALPAPELRQWLTEHGEAPFRVRQIVDWIFRRGTPEPQRMTNLPETLRSALSDGFHAPGSRIAERTAALDGTEKLLIALADGETVEMVLIPGADGRLTFCLSTQVGCPVRCRFCASGRDGLIRNLAAGEMLEEFLLGMQAAGRRPDNLVFMGIGEGLLNFDELASALDALTDPERFGMSPRRITVSTSGYLPGMRRFAELGKEFTLAVSLHAPEDELRARLIPDPLRFPVAEILAEADRYLERAGRMVTLEYTLLRGVNDRRSDAEKLGRLAREHRAKVNLIAYNETGGEFSRPSRETIRSFAQTVAAAGAHVTVRAERGAPSAAACGQLRRFRRPSGVNTEHP